MISWRVVCLLVNLCKFKVTKSRYFQTQFRRLVDENKPFIIALFNMTSNCQYFELVAFIYYL